MCQALLLEERLEVEIPIIALAKSYKRFIGAAMRKRRR
jgi:hypothetical protein